MKKCLKCKQGRKGIEDQDEQKGNAKSFCELELKWPVKKLITSPKTKRLYEAIIFSDVSSVQLFRVLAVDVKYKILTINEHYLD